MLKKMQLHSSCGVHIAHSDVTCRHLPWRRRSMAHRGAVPHFDEEDMEDTKKKRKRRGVILLLGVGVLYNASSLHCVHLSSKLSPEMNSAHPNALHRVPRGRDGLPSTFLFNALQAPTTGPAVRDHWPPPRKSRHRGDNMAAIRADLVPSRPTTVSRSSIRARIGTLAPIW